MLLFLSMSEPLRTESIEARILYEKGAGEPFIKNKAVPAATASSALESEKVRGKYERISREHGRSMTETASSKKVVWGGPFSGDIFGARNIKGTNMSEIKIESTIAEQYGVRAHGLMDDTDIPRIERASEVLRKNGLPTEALRAIVELKNVWAGGEKDKTRERVPVGIWKLEELKRIKKEKPELYEKTKTYFKETKFVAIERDVQVDERVEDLIAACEENRLRQFLEPVFKWLNVATAVKNGGIIAGTPKPEGFEYKKQDIYRYFASYLPSQMGIYLGRLHKLGLAHGSPHAQNWSAIGTLYDTDSVYGKPVFSDDEAPTRNALIGEISLTYANIHDLISSLRDTNEFRVADPDKIEDVACYNFVHSYLAARFGKVTSYGIKLIEDTNIWPATISKVVQTLNKEFNQRSGGVPSQHKIRPKI